MPSPVGHALGGVIVGLLGGLRTRGGGVPGRGGSTRTSAATHPTDASTLQVRPGTGPGRLQTGGATHGTSAATPHTPDERPRHPDGSRRAWLPNLFSPTVLLAAVAGVAPDLDFLWGRHNMETHSLGMAMLAGLAVVAWTRGRDLRLAAVIALAWASHVLFDWLGSDTTSPLGVMALWPLSSEFYFAHAYVFEAISRRTHLPNFWPHNLWAVMLELLLLGPLAALAAWRAARATY